MIVLFAKNRKFSKVLRKFLENSQKIEDIFLISGIENSGNFRRILRKLSKIVENLRNWRHFVAFLKSQESKILEISGKLSKILRKISENWRHFNAVF